MEILPAGDSEEGIGRGKVAGFDGGGLVGLFFELRGNLDRW